MSLAVAAAVTTLAAFGDGDGDGDGHLPPFVESRVDCGTDKFEYQLADVDGDARADLFVTSVASGERKLRLWRQRDDATFPAAPDFKLDVPPDVVSWTLFDTRPDPGREVVLMTRGGLFSLSTAKEGLQGNLRRELALPLFPDLADPDRLPCWRLMKDVDGDGKEELLVVSGRELVALCVVTASDGSTKLEPKLRLPCEPSERDAGSAAVSFGGGGLAVSSRRGAASLFPGARSSRPTFDSESLLARSEGFDLPALFDWNGDGRVDAVDFTSRAIGVRLQQKDGSFAAETSVALPDAIVEKEDEPRRRRRRGASHVELRDCDGDGRLELVATREAESREHVALVFPRDAEGRPAATPSARVKIAAMEVEYELLDVDHDGRLDLVARVLDVPTGLTSLATIRLDTAFEIFRGGRGDSGPTLSREPDVRFERSFRPEQLSRVQETLLTKIDGDFDQDGLNDLVFTQLDGRVEIRPLVRDGDGLELSSKPLASFQPPQPVERMETWDLSGDGVADLMLRHERGFTLYVSKKSAAKDGAK
jgi:hypothetical protein